MYYPLIWLLNKSYVYIYIYTYIHTNIYKHTQFKILSMFIHDITFIFSQYFWWTNLSLYRLSHWCVFGTKNTQGLRASCSMRIRPRWDPNRGRFPRRWLVVGDAVTWLVDSQGPRFFCLCVILVEEVAVGWLVGWLLKKKTCWFKV